MISAETISPFKTGVELIDHVATAQPGAADGSIATAGPGGRQTEAFQNVDIERVLRFILSAASTSLAAFSASPSSVAIRHAETVLSSLSSWREKFACAALAALRRPIMWISVMRLCASASSACAAMSFVYQRWHIVC